MNSALQETLAAKKMKAPPPVLMIGAECAPFAKTGGLADVIGTLTREMKRLGFDARLMLPFHRVIKDRYRERVRHLVSFSVDIGGRSQYVGIEQFDGEDIPVYFIDNEHYFGHAIYCGGNFEGPLGLYLAFDFTKIGQTGQTVEKKFFRIEPGGGKHFLSPEKSNHIG